MNIKNTNLFSNQSGSSHIARIKQDALNKVKSSYPNGYLVKDETEQNSRMTALSRMRNSGYIVPRQFAYYGGRVTFPYAPKYITLTVISESVIRVAFTSPDIRNTIYTVTSNLGDVSTGASSPITVSELLSNTIYTFTVTATNIIGSASSIISSLETTTKPDAPIIVSSTALSPTSVSIYFISPSGNGTITGYTVTSSPNGLTSTGMSSPIIVSGLTANTAYTFSVTATNSSGTSISSSSISRDININTSVTTIPDSPSIVIATVISANIVNIYFIESNGTGVITNYTVTSNLGDVSTGTSSPISVKGLISNTSYTFRISAINSGGISLHSDESIPVTTLLSIPNAPIIGKAIIVSDNEISVAFIEPNILPGTGMITHYTVTSIPDGFISTGTSSPISIIGLPSNTYIFTVTATNMDGTSLPSGESNIVTTTKTVSPIIGIISVLSSTEVSVGFTISSGTGLMYTVISSPEGLIGTGTSSPITVSGLSSNSEYTFMVSATNIFGSASSCESSLVITKPNSPTIDSISVLSSTEVSVCFTPPSGTGIITSYTIISSPEGLIGTGTSSPITVSGLSSNTEYTFTAVATNSGGISVSSDAYRQVSVTTKPDSPTIDSISVLSSTEVSVCFTPSIGTGIITSYTIISSPEGLIGTGTSSPITVSGLSSNTEYTFTAVATNSGGISILSDVSSSVTTKPESPMIDTVSVLSSTEVKVSFTVPSGTGTITEYIVTSNLGDIGICTSSPITVSGLLSNTEYTFTVSATNYSGTAISSLSSFVTTNPEPPTIGIAIVISSTEVSVAFTTLSDVGITDYIVTSNLGDIGTGTSSPITVSGLLSNTLYTFTVTATNSGRISFASSPSSSVTTKVSSPIINYLTALSNTEINVAFTPSNEVDGVITYYTATSNPGNFTEKGASSPIIVSGLTANTYYTFTVSAIRHLISRRPIVLSVSKESSSESTIPDPPELGIITVLSKTSVSVGFIQQPSKGDGIIINYTATSSPGGLIGTGMSSPITISGLTPYESYTFTVSATNSGGTSIQSSASSYISPY